MPIKEKILFKEMCKTKGDFGFTNLYGTPTLMFDVQCHLRKGHKGHHQGNEVLNIKPSFEPNGLNVVRDSVKFTKVIVIDWVNKDD